jgi:hypothetical protein
MRPLALLGAWVLCLTSGLRAQETGSQASIHPIRDSAARIAREVRTPHTSRYNFAGRDPAMEAILRQR